MKRKNHKTNNRKTLYSKDLIKTKWLGILGIAISLISCSSSQMGTSDGNYYIEFSKQDFTISEKVTAEATEVRILGIDFKRLFKKESGNFEQRGYAINPKVPVPLLGSKLSPTQVQNYALHTLLANHPEYDVVLYPRFEEKTLKIPVFYKKTETKVSARLGKL